MSIASHEDAFRGRLGPLLFYGGLLIATTGFLADKADNLPWVLNVVAGSYVRAERGLQRLEIAGSLSKGEPGFIELESLFRSQADAAGVGPQFHFRSVERFERGTAMLALGEARAGEVVPVAVVLTGTRVNWDMAGLKNRAELLKRSLLLRFSTLVFGLGVAVALFGRTLEKDRTKVAAPKERPPTFE